MQYFNWKTLKEGNTWDTHRFSSKTKEYFVPSKSVICITCRVLVCYGRWPVGCPTGFFPTMWPWEGLSRVPRHGLVTREM